jgi:lysozyme
MDIADVYRQIATDEGTSLVVYLDTEGNPTAGIGHELTPDEIAEYPVGSAITQDQCEAWYQADVAAAITGCEQAPAIPFYGQPDAVQDSLVNMCFNMGPERLSGFTDFLAYIGEHNYAAAAEDLLNNTLWAKQLPARAARIAAAIGGLVTSISRKERV